MDSLYRLFALAWLAERESYRNIEHYENVLAAQGMPEPQYAVDAVFASLINEWDEAHKDLKAAENSLITEYRRVKAESTFSVISAQ